jgi:hypothetical protein
MKRNHPHHLLVAPAYEIVKAHYNPPDTNPGEPAVKPGVPPSWEECLDQADAAMTADEEAANASKLAELKQEEAALDHH